MLVSKEGPSSEAQLSDVKPPPPYSHATAGTSTNSYVIPPTTNYVNLSGGRKSIKGIWSIDPTLAIPTLLLPELPDDAPEDYIRPNLRLHTNDGTVHADVWLGEFNASPTLDLKSDPTLTSSDVYTTLDIFAKDGAITLIVNTHGPRALKIKAISGDGRISVYLPRDFRGILRYEARDGQTTFSPLLASVVSTFSIEKSKGKSFVGDWSDLKEGDPWTGDECEVLAKDGSIRFFWAEEYSRAPPANTSWWKTLLG